MTDIQIFAFFILPIVVAALAWVVALAVNPPHWLRRMARRRKQGNGPPGS